MTLSSPVSAQVSSAIDQWFHTQAKELNLLAPIPELATIKQVLEQHLPQRVKRQGQHIQDRENPTQWLQIVLKASHLIQLHLTPDHPTTIAVTCTTNHPLATEQLELIRSHDFRDARAELGIDRQVFLVLPGYPLQMPKGSELLDGLYRVLEGDEDCGVVLMG